MGLVQDEESMNVLEDMIQNYANAGCAKRPPMSAMGMLLPSPIRCPVQTDRRDDPGLLDFLCLDKVNLNSVAIEPVFTRVDDCSPRFAP